MSARRNSTHDNGKKVIHLNDMRIKDVRANMKRYVSQPHMCKVLPLNNHNILSSTNDVFDSNNDKIFKGRFTAAEEEEITVVAHHDLVTPAYLVEIEVESDLREIVTDVLYNKLKVYEFDKTDNTMFQAQSSCKDSISKTSKEPTYSVEMFINELKKEIEANQQAETKHIESQFYHHIKFLIPQLTFEVSNLINSLNEDSMDYKTLSLEDSDTDYEFIMHSLNDKGCAKIPKVLHMFRIIPADQTYDKYLYNNYLNFQGITADQVMKIFKQGYPKNYQSLLEQHEIYCFDKKLFSSKKCSCYSSARFDLELKKGTSYCRVGDEVKQLSFVFVTSDVHLKNLVVPSEVPLEDSDSRRCRFDPEFCSPSFILNMVPAYLIVFSL